MFGVYVEYTSCSGDTHEFILSTYNHETCAQEVAKYLNNNRIPKYYYGHNNETKYPYFEEEFVVYPYEVPRYNVLAHVLEEERTKQPSQKELLEKTFREMGLNVGLTPMEKEVKVNHRDETMLKTAEGYDFEASLKE